jgi:phage FluMu gp28-like protein
MEGAHSATTRPNYKANYVSINQEEASDKISIARNLYFSIPDELKELGLKPPLYNNNAYELAFFDPPHVSVLHSQPASSAIRGGKKDIYFDEFAHIRDAAKLYQAALPAISRGEGRMTIISTPLGESGLFYDICADVDAYPGYSRHSVPWWEFTGYVKEGAYEEALALAPELDTKTRLERYARGAILTIFEGFGNDIQQFQTEYEATFVDELSSFFPWSLITENVDDEQGIWASLPPGWTPEGYVSIGIDLAKTKDESVFTVVEHIENDDGDVERYVRFVYATQEEYEDQWRYIKSLAKRSGAKRITIDQTGLGQVFVEKAKADPEVADINIEGIAFTNPKKEAWATTLKADLQKNTVHYPRHPDLMRQIHGIQRVKSEAGFFKFSGKKDDYFWSLCLALYGEGRIPPRISSI